MKLTKTKLKSSSRVAWHSSGVSICAGALLLISSSAQAQNIFVSDYYSGNIYQYTPGGTRSTFATGLPNPLEVAVQGVMLPVPEPSTLGLLAAGVAALLVQYRRRRDATART